MSLLIEMSRVDIQCLLDHLPQGSDLREILGSRMRQCSPIFALLAFLILLSVAKSRLVAYCLLPNRIVQ